MSSLRHQRETGETARDVCLDAAREVILAVGWRKTTLTAIARQAGLSRMTLYRTWPDTAALLSDLLSRECGALVLAAIEDDQPGTERPETAERFATQVVATVRGLRHHDLLRRLVFGDPDLLLPYLFGRLGRSQRAVFEIAVSMIEQGQAVGGIRAGDPAIMARAVLLAGYGYWLSAHTMADDEITIEILDDQLRVQIAGYLRP